MKIFILEDDENRIKVFKRSFIGIDLTMTDLADEAIKRLKTEKYDFIFLDHDLGGEVFVDSQNKNTGSEVAKHITHTLNKSTMVIIHSFNPSGAKNMFDIMKSYKMECVIAPFLGKDFNLIIGQIQEINKKNNSDLYNE